MDSTPLTSALVRIENAYQEEILTDSGLRLYLDPSYEKSYNCTVTGVIAALPLKAKNKYEQQILDQLEIGDEICMSYRVVADFQYASDAGQFMSAYEENPYMQFYINGKGEQIQVMALPTKVRGHNIWVGTMSNQYGEFINGCQGTESEVENWKLQFPFGKTDNYIFNNLLNLNGQDYWICDLSEIYAKKVKGHIVALGQKVICTPVEEEVPEAVKASLKYIGKDLNIRYTDRAKVLSGGKAGGLKKGQIISFDPMVLEKYNFFDKNYYIVNENRINGIWKNK